MLGWFILLLKNFKLLCILTFTRFKNKTWKYSQINYVYLSDQIICYDLDESLSIDYLCLNKTACIIDLFVQVYIKLLKKFFENVR